MYILSYIKSGLNTFSDFFAHSGQESVWSGLLRLLFVDIEITSATHREFFFEILLNKSKADCIYHFPFDLEPKERSFGFKSFGKW